MILPLAALTLLRLLPTQDAQERRIESRLRDLLSEKDETARAALRTELEAFGKPVLPAVKRLLDDHLARLRKAGEQAEAVVERHLADLDSDAPKVREAATLAIVELGEPVLPILRKHENNPSAEIRGRLKAIADRIEQAKSGPRILDEAIYFYSRLSTDPSSAAVFALGFQSRHVPTRTAALKAWSEAALPDDYLAVQPLLRDPDLGVRTLAVRAVYELGLERAAPLLVDVIRSETDRQLWQTATGLAARWRVLWTPDVTRRMAEILEQAEAPRRQFLIWALFQSGFPLPDPPEMLADALRKLSEQERGPLLKNWWFVAEREPWVRILGILSSDRDPALAAKARELYEKITLEEFGGADVFTQKYATATPAVRAALIRGFARSEGESKPIRALPIILQEKDPALRKQVIDAAFLNATWVSGAVLRDALWSGIPELAAAASDWTHPNSRHETYAAYRYAIETTADPALRARFAFNLAVLGDPIGVPQIAPMLQHPDARMRARAVQAIQATGAAELLKKATDLLKDPTLEVRRLTAEALIASGDPAFMEPLWNLKGDEALVTMLPEAVGALGRPADLERLEKAAQELPRLKVYLPSGLMSWSPAKPLPIVTALAKDPDRQIRENAEKALAHVRGAAEYLADLNALGPGKGMPPSFSKVFGQYFSFRFVFAPFDKCTPAFAAERRAVPIPIAEFLRSFTQYHHSAYESARGNRCPTEVLEALEPGHPLLQNALKLVATHPCPESAKRLAVLSVTAETGYATYPLILRGDPLLARRLIVGGLDAGTNPEPSHGFLMLAQFLPPDELVPLAERSSASPHAAVAKAARGWLASLSPDVLGRMLDRGLLKDRPALFRALAGSPTPDHLRRLEAVLHDPDLSIRAIAAAALLEADRPDLIPEAIRILKDSGEAGWDLAAAIVPRIAPEHAALLPEESPSMPVHALRARLGRKDSAARVLAGLPDSDSGIRAAAWSLAPHLDPDIEKKLLAEAERRKEPHTQLALAMALARSPHADTRTRVMTWLKKMPLYQEGGHIEPAFRLALETLIDRGEPGALERAAQYWAYGVTSIKQETLGLITRAKTDEAAALLLESLNTSIDESRKLTPLVLETIRDMPKGPKTREKLLLLLARNQLWTPPAMLPLFVEVGEEKAFEDVLEKAVRKSQGPWVPLRSLDLLSRTTNGKERLRVIADDLAASQEPSAKVTSALARLLSGGAPAVQEWRTSYLAGASHETALMVSEFRLLDAIGEMGRRARNELSPAQDRGLDSAIPLMTCTSMRPPVSGSPTYWPDLVRFLRELTVWIRTHRAMTFEQVLAQALRARGYGVAGPSVTVADAETLVAALEDREDAIAVNAAWMLSRLSRRPPHLSAMEGDGRGFELIRPSPVEIADWKRWLDTRK